MNPWSNAVPSSQRDAVRQQLEEGLSELNLALEPAQLKRLEDYLWLLVKWNKAYNLSAVRDPHAMVTLHLLDSLAIVPYLAGHRFLDVGTGAGLPGVPLAIALPEQSFSLLDSAGKKTRFLTEVKQSLELGNIQVENRRVESFRPGELFDGVISRAFASLHDMVTQCCHLLDSDGAFWAMKGQYPEQELRSIANQYSVEGHYPLQIPGLQAERCLLRIVRSVS